MTNIFTKKPLPRTLKKVYEDLNLAIGNIEAGIPEDGSVTNVKLATDVKVGSLALLETTGKASVVGAINEVAGSIENAAGDIEDLQGEVGELSGLTTTEKGSIVAAINELVTRIAAIET